MISQSTLEKWAHMSIKERAAAAQKKFKVNITPTLIQRLYKKHNVNFKKVRYFKTEVLRTEEEEKD